MENHHLSENSTFYQFRLVRKIHYSKVLIYAYLVVLGLPLGVLIKAYSLTGLVVMVGEGVLLLFVHALILLILIKVQLNLKVSHWSFQILLPWVGFLPKQYISLSSFKQIHHHLFWVGLVVMGFFSPWYSFYLISTLGFLHVWILMPRFIIFYLLRSENPDGVVKLNQQDTSYFMQ